MQRYAEKFWQCFFLLHVSNDKNSNHFFSPDQENIPLPEIGKSFREMGIRFRFRSDWAFRAFANISYRGKIVHLVKMGTLLLWLLKLKSNDMIMSKGGKFRHPLKTHVEAISWCTILIDTGLGSATGATQRESETFDFLLWRQLHQQLMAKPN